MQHSTQWMDRISGREAVVAVIGLGYVGLPLVRAFVEAGFQTIGFDTDDAKIARLRAGESYIRHVDSAWLADAVQAGRFRPTGDHTELAQADAILICVPTPLTESRDPDLQFVEETARLIATVLRPGQLVVLESTTYPGTTRDVVGPLLRQSGLEPERDFFLAYSPEREDPGNAEYGTRSIPKVVGGVGPHSAAAAEALYRQVVVEVVPVASAEVAETCKILENTYRAVNIALVNELKLICERLGISVWDVIAAAATKPFGFQAFYPGPGLGGHCIPIDPYYLSWLARKLGLTTRFVELAGEVNRAMPAHVVERTMLALNDQGKCVKGSKILILGVAYKRDIDDPRESPAFAIMEALIERGARVAYSDPFFPSLPSMRAHHLPPLDSVPLTAETLEDYDAVIIVTDHSAFDYEFVVNHARLVVDSRNATRGVTAGRDKIILA